MQGSRYNDGGIENWNWGAGVQADVDLDNWTITLKVAPMVNETLLGGAGAGVKLTLGNTFNVIEVDLATPLSPILEGFRAFQESWSKEEPESPMDYEDTLPDYSSSWDTEHDDNPMEYDDNPMEYDEGESEYDDSPMDYEDNPMDYDDDPGLYGIAVHEEEEEEEGEDDNPMEYDEDAHTSASSERTPEEDSGQDTTPLPPDLEVGTIDEEGARRAYLDSWISREVPGAQPGAVNPGWERAPTNLGAGQSPPAAVNTGDIDPPREGQTPGIHGEPPAKKKGRGDMDPPEHADLRGDAFGLNDIDSLFSLLGNIGGGTR